MDAVVEFCLSYRPHATRRFQDIVPWRHQAAGATLHRLCRRRQAYRASSSASPRRPKIFFVEQERHDCCEKRPMSNKARTSTTPLDCVGIQAGSPSEEQGERLQPSVEVEMIAEDSVISQSDGRGRKKGVPQKYQQTWYYSTASILNSYGTWSVTPGAVLPRRHLLKKTCKEGIRKWIIYICCHCFKD